MSSKRSRSGRKISKGRNGGSRAPPRKKRYFQPGYDRTGGYYGRYSGRQPEAKFFNTVVSDAVVTTTMVISNLTVVPEGNGESERVGRKINIKSIHVRGSLTLPSTTTMADTSDVVICMLVQDTQTNGAAFAATDLLDTDGFTSFRNLANSTRFRILYKKIYALKIYGAAPSGAALVSGEDVRAININKRVNIPMEYDNSASTGAIGTVRSNNVYWVTQSSAGISGTALTARIRYTDR